MNYAGLSRKHSLKFEAIKRGNLNAATEIDEFMDYFGKTVVVVKGRKVAKGTTGTVFWLKRYDYSKYGDPWGIYSKTRIGIKDSSGEVFFTSLDNVTLEKQE